MRLAVLALALLAGCESSEELATTEVRRIAALEHGCSTNNIKILVYDPAIGGFRLDVCGKLRVYRFVPRVGYVDVTSGASSIPGTH